MSDEAVVDQEIEADAAEAEEVEAVEAETEEVEAEEIESDGDEPEDEEAEEDEEIELNFGGNKKSFSAKGTAKEVAAQAQEFADSVWSDYTRKSQDLSEQRKSLEAQASAVEKLQSLSGDALDAYSKGLQLRAEIEQLQSHDLSALWQSDPDRARRVSDLLAQKQAEFQRAVQTVSQKEGELTQAQQAEMARRIAEGEAQIEAKVKGFKAEKLPEVIDYAVNSLGMDRDQASKEWALNPQMTLAVWKAAQFDKMQAAAKKTPTPKPAEPVQGRKPKGGKPLSDPARMSPKEMAKYLGLPG